MPDARVMLARAIIYFERALQERKDGWRRGSTSKALAQTLVQLAEIEETPVDAPRVLALCAEVCTLPPPEALAFAQRLDTHFTPPARTDTDSHSNVFKEPDAPDGMLMRAQQMGRSDARGALALLRDNESLFAQGNENHRIVRLTLMCQLIGPAFGSVDLTQFTDSTEQSVEAMARTAASQQWPV